jgi:hypothetical protein
MTIGFFSADKEISTKNPELYDHFMWISALSTFVIGVCFPLAMIFFFGSRNVKAICEAENPQKNWTDHCPLPLLFFSLWEIFAVVLYIFFVSFTHFTILFLGIVFSGLIGALLIAGISMGRIYIAWGFYHQKIQAWWTALFFIIFITAPIVLFSTLEKNMEMYRSMGYSSSLLDRLQKDQENGHINWVEWISLVGVVIYLFFVRKYFLGNAQRNKGQTQRHTIKKKGNKK